MRVANVYRKPKMFVAFCSECDGWHLESKPLSKWITRKPEKREEKDFVVQKPRQPKERRTFKRDPKPPRIGQI
jgi:hypothetical protein